MRTMTFPPVGLRFLAAAVLLLFLGRAAGAAEEGWTPLGAEDNFAAWRQPTGDWYVAGDARVDPNNTKALVGTPGKGVMINGQAGRTKSLVTKQPFEDVELHVEFMVARNSNSGVIFHGNYEIQILDSYGVKQPKGGDCGGIYPRAEAEPTYHHIDEGHPPKVNAAKPPGEWQALDIIFRAARFDDAGKKTANAKFVKVVLNGHVIQENQEVPYATGTNWDRKQVPRGPIILQGDYGPVAFRNVRVRPWKAGAEVLNVPPEGFTALFNGKDFTGWRLSPKGKAMWTVEDGALKSHGLLPEWGADLETEKKYKDFVLLVDFRMPTLSDSGINFRGLIPQMENFGQTEQFNIRSKGGMGHLESFYFMPEAAKQRLGLQEKDLPHAGYIDPEIGVWHTVKLTVIGKNVTAEYDGKVILDHFEYPEGVLSLEPATIRFQKHVVVDGQNLGEMNPCPIEYRNIFIKEIEPGTVEPPAKRRVEAAEGGRPLDSPNAGLLSRIDRNDLPQGYTPAKHQEYVDRRMAGLSEAQRAKVGQLWKEKQQIHPDMPNRGMSFVKILEYVAANGK